MNKIHENPYIENISNELNRSSGYIEIMAELQGSPDFRNLVEQHITISALDLSIFTENIKKNILYKASKNEILDISNKSQKRKINNQEFYIPSLLGTELKLLDELIEISAKISMFRELYVDIEDSGIHNKEEQALLKKLSDWELAINEISNAITRANKIDNEFDNLVEEKIKDLKSSVNGKKSYEDRLKSFLSNTNSKEKIAKIFDERDKNNTDVSLISKRLMQEYLETAYTINTLRVLNRIQEPLSEENQLNTLIDYIKLIEKGDEQFEDALKVKIDGKSAKETYEEYLKNLFVIDFENFVPAKVLEENLRKDLLRYLTISREKIDSEIDLVKIKNSIHIIFERAKELKESNNINHNERQELEKLDEEFIEYMILIANKVARIFPHLESTTLTDILQNENAVCAGKVSVLLAISNYLNIETNSTVVDIALDNEAADHQIFECKLPTGKRLVIDTNFRKKYYLTNGNTLKESAELSNLKYITNSDIEFSDLDTIDQRMAGNLPFINKKSNILIYTIDKSDEKINNNNDVERVKEEPYKLIRVNPTTGKREVYTSSIPYPHLYNIPDRNDNKKYLHSGLLLNMYIDLKSSKEHNSNVNNKTMKIVAEELTKIAPHSKKGHKLYLSLLAEDKNQFKEYLEKIRKNYKEVFYDGFDLNLAFVYGREKNFEKYKELLDDVYNSNPERYYEILPALIRYLPYKESYEIIENSRVRDTELFDKYQDNIIELIRNGDLLNKITDEEIINLYIKAKNIDDKKFFTLDNINLNPINLVNKISTLKSSKENTDYDELLKETLERLKGDKNFWNKGFYTYLSRYFEETNDYSIYEQAIKEDPDFYKITQLSSSRAFSYLRILIRNNEEGNNLDKIKEIISYYKDYENFKNTEAYKRIEKQMSIYNLKYILEEIFNT